MATFETYDQKTLLDRPILIRQKMVGNAKQHVDLRKYSRKLNRTEMFCSLYSVLNNEYVFYRL